LIVAVEGGPIERVGLAVSLVMEIEAEAEFIVADSVRLPSARAGRPVREVE
jgi:hypothetical protein